MLFENAVARVLQTPDTSSSPVKSIGELYKRKFTETEFLILSLNARSQSLLALVNLRCECESWALYEMTVQGSCC